MATLREDRAVEARAAGDDAAEAWEVEDHIAVAVTAAEAID
jgi:hypothetical protein